MSLGKREGSPEAARDASVPAAKRVKDEAPQFGDDRASSRPPADVSPVKEVAAAHREASQPAGPAHTNDTTDGALPQSPLDVDYIICHLTVPEDAEVARAHSNTRTADKQVQAYAKLAGRNWTFYVQQLEIVIGRAAAESSDRVDIDLGPSKIVSRKHAVIQYNLQKRQWEVSVTGRNGLRVDGYHLKQGMTLSLRSGHVLDVGNAQMMFVLPDAEPLVARVFVERAREAKEQAKKLAQDHANTMYPVEMRHEHVTSPETMSSSYPRGVAIVSRPQVAAGQGFEQDLGSDECKDIKPPFSYATMITQAILSTDDHMMSLADIYAWISRHYAFYRHSKPGWQNSIRHNLSLNKAFEKVARKEHEPGKGSKWHIVPEYKEELARKATTGKQFKNRPVSPRRSSVRETTRNNLMQTPMNNGGLQGQTPMMPPMPQGQAPFGTPGYGGMPIMQPGQASSAVPPQPGQRQNEAQGDQHRQQQPPAGFPMPMPFQDMNGNQYPLQPFQYMQPFGMPYMHAQQPGQPPMIPMMPPMAPHNQGQPQGNYPNANRENEGQQIPRPTNLETRGSEERQTDESRVRSQSQSHSSHPDPSLQGHSHPHSQHESQPQSQSQSQSQPQPQPQPPQSQSQSQSQSETQPQHHQAQPQREHQDEFNIAYNSYAAQRGAQAGAEPNAEPGTQTGLPGQLQPEARTAPGSVVMPLSNATGPAGATKSDSASNVKQEKGGSGSGSGSGAPFEGTQTPARAPRPPTGDETAQTPLGGPDVRLAPPTDGAAPESSPALWKYMNLESTPNNNNISANGGSSRTLTGDVLASKGIDNESPANAKHTAAESGRVSPPGSSPPGIAAKGSRSPATDIPVFKPW